MPENFYLNEPLLIGLMNQLNSYGNDLETGTKELVAYLDQHIGCWGTDDIGNQFANNYCSNADYVAQDGLDGGKGMEQTAANMITNAKELSSVDYQSAAWMDSHSSPGG